MANKQEQGKYLTLDRLLELSDLRQEDKFIPRLGANVRMRELSAAEVFHIREGSTKADATDAKKQTAMMLSLAMIEPKMTEADVMALWEKSSKVVDELANAYKEMSGTSAEAQKEAENSFRKQSGEGVPVQAGGQAGDDGSAT